MQGVQLERALELADKQLRRSCLDSKIPEYMIEGLVRYVLYGVKPGSFLVSAIANDLIGAAIKSDDENKKVLFNWAMVLYRDLPTESKGSYEIVEGWVSLNGLEGWLGELDVPIRVVVDDEVVGAEGRPITEEND